ncbi:FAD/FMN-containing dehydrogenase [Amycolatopsis echigonensis]|uniref:FAD/FMN-containing dehydrogenase n=1 Tax=Amycolatopsis echigonensis TaxID=2576905 RepID=A0A2N3WV42_9PSEU|nr:FAD-binding oxidoreductase [Amycolatopsis niigatensis]PKV97746.1 FAD/FMN-containing dehydrogenase [Amycolatopsis niigatensis]
MTAEDVLRARLSAGQVHTSGPQYESAATVWNAAVAARPAVVVECRSTADVQASVRASRELGLPLSVRSGGHDWAGRAVADGGIMLDLRPLNRVAVDAGRRAAVVGGGARANDVLAAAEAHGLTAAVGTIGAVGFAGLALGGGYGPFLGEYGLAADNLLGAEIVLADGEVVLANASRLPDLWWALRGGGGNFGVVTSLGVRLHATPRITTGPVWYPASDAARVFAAVAEIQAGAPDDLTVQTGMLAGADGSLCVVVWPTWCGPADPDGFLARLGPPLASNIETVSSYAAEVASRDAMFPDGRSVVIRTRSLPAFAPEAVSALLAQMEAMASPLSGLSIHHFHGSAARVPVADTAFPLREDHLMVEVLGMGEGADDRGWADAVSEALAPFALPEAYANLLGPDVPSANVFGRNSARLRDVKHRYDPDGVFRAIPLG